nr:integrase, catalytic region, zinc finger, CCHC-type, peptidase aspartic, catalytic [Tanacetum cinerariifolium]
MKSRITLDTHNWSSFTRQELHKIVKDEIFPIVNQVDARVQNFEIQFLKEAAKFVGDFKSLAKEADESLAKHKVLELEIERFLREVVSQDIISIVQNNSVVDTSNLQTELERMKERFENCIIKKENEYAKLWNDCYKKCEECKFEKISYDKAYKDMQQKIERLQAQLGDIKGKSKDSSCVLDTFYPLSQKLENENVELEFQDITRSSSANTKFAKQAISRKPPPKVGETHALSKPVTANSIPTPRESNSEKLSVVDNTKTRRPQPRSNTKNDRVSFASKSSHSKNKEVEVEEHHRKLQLSRNKKHMSTECNNVKLATQNVKTKVVCAMCKQCLYSVNHDVCLLNYVNGMNSRGKNQKANVSINEHQKKQKPKVIQICLWCVDSGCSKHMTENLKLLINFVWTFLGTVRFGNDHVAAILGQFCDSDLEAEAIATACFTQNRSIIHRRFNKTPYELINGKKSDIFFLHVFGALYYPKNDREDIRKLGEKGDIGFFIGYSADSYAYRVFNRRTKKIIKTMNVTFDELLAMAFEQRSSKLGLESMTSGQITMYDDYIDGQSSATLRTVSAAQAHQVRQTPTTSTSIADTTPTPTNSSSQATNFPISSQDVDGLNSQQQHALQQGNQAPI